MVSITDTFNSTDRWNGLAYPSSECLTVTNLKGIKSNHYTYGNGSVNGNIHHKVKQSTNNKINSNDSNNSALFDSIRNQRYRQCLLLTQSGQDVNGRNGSGETPLIYLIKTLNRKENRKMRVKFAKLLLDFGANPNVQDSRGQTALIHATIKAQDDVIQLLLAHDDTDITIQDKEGNTALMYGSKGGQLNVVECFIDHFIKRELDPNLLRQRNNYGKNALEIAKEESKAEIISLLTNYLTQFNSIYSKDLERWTSIHPVLSKAKSLDSISIESDGTYITTDYHHNNGSNNNRYNSQYHLNHCKGNGRSGDENDNEDNLLSSQHHQQKCSLSRCNNYLGSNNNPSDHLANFNGLKDANNFESALRRKIENLKSVNRSSADFYEEIWEQETMSWFNGDNLEGDKMGQSINGKPVKKSTSNLSSAKEIKSDGVKTKANVDVNQEALKLPPIGSNRLIDYKTWCDMANSSTSSSNSLSSSSKMNVYNHNNK